MLLFPGAATPTTKRHRFSEKSSPVKFPRASPATSPDRCAMLDNTAMDNLVNDCMAARAPTPRDYMKFAESKRNKKAKPIKSGNKAKAYGEQVSLEGWQGHSKNL